MMESYFERTLMSTGVTGTAMLGGCLLVILLFALSSAFYGWMVILGFGIVHSFAPSVPAIGFLWGGWGLGAILAVILPNGSSSVSK